MYGNILNRNSSSRASTTSSLSSSHLLYVDLIVHLVVHVVVHLLVVNPLACLFLSIIALLSQWTTTRREIMHGRQLVRLQHCPLVMMDNGNMSLGVWTQ